MVGCPDFLSGVADSRPAASDDFSLLLFCLLLLWLL
jgi:hypothetical protein